MSDSSPPNYVPHVVLRLMAAVYSSLNLYFQGEEPLPSATFVDLPRPTRPVTPEERPIYIKAVLAFVIKRGLRCCIVFGRNDAVYCERDGLGYVSNDPPSGGIAC